MKRNLMLICLALAIAVLSVAFVACDTTTAPDDGGGTHNSYEAATYTVTFEVNSSDFKLTNNVIKDVPAGSTIEAPKDSSGNTITPYKIGYEFQFWSADGSSAFNFGVDTINAPTTLTAIYTNKEYKHELCEEYDEAKVGYFYVNQRLDYKSDGTYSIVRDDSIGASITEGTTLTLTYAQTSTLDCPIPSTGDRFLFWFYMKDGKPVQLSKAAGETDSTVVTSAKYSTASKINIFAMFESTLPKATVTFEGANDAEKIKEFPINGTISSSDAPIASKSGYVFVGWYYETEDEDGVVEEHDFSITDDENGTIGTSLYSACALSDYFTPAELTLKPRFIKQLSIANKDDYMTKLYNVLHGDDEDAIKEILTADIKLYGCSIDFEGAELEPLFDAEHVFAGSIDGGSYKQSGELDKKAQLSNIKAIGTTQVSLFGYVSGTIKNIDVTLTLSPSKQDDAYADKILIGGIASENKGSIENCTVKATLDVSRDDVPNAIVFGGICAVNSGSADASGTGYIYKCSAELTIGALKCEALMLGGIAAQSNAASTIASCRGVKITADSIACADDGNANNGRSFAKIGGITASNGGGISKSNADIAITSLESLEEAYFGGISAEGSGSITEAYAQALLTARVGGSVSQSVCIGGLVGRNEGYVLNAYCDATISVTAIRKNANIALGGIVGSNVSDKKDTTSSQTQGIGAINSAYSTGAITLTVDEQTSGVSAYVGGLVGRNTQSKISSCFTAMDIVVVNGGTNRIGYTFGSAEKNLPTQTSLIFYAEDNTLKLNGEDVELDLTKLTGSSTTEKANYKTGIFYSTKGMSFDSEIWSMPVGDEPSSLPTLKYFQN